MSSSKPRRSPPPVPTASRTSSGIRSKTETLATAIPQTETANASTRHSVLPDETFDADSEPTRPHRGIELRLIAERVLASPPSDVAVLRALRHDAMANCEGSKEWARYTFACMLFVERLLAP
jgi:hypothetical protein